MILSNDCYLKSTCTKIHPDHNKWVCDGEEQFCLRLFKQDYLFEESCLTKDQRKRIQLRVDADNTDREQFVRLNQIATDIVSFVDNGNNLYIYSEMCGNGKTAWSIRLLQEYFDKIWWKCDLSCHGLFVNVPRFFFAL